MRRYQRGQVTLNGFVLDFPDGPSLAAIAKDVFERQLYKFHASSPTPLIIDGGANIGVSVLYFLHEYPGARVLAYEADPSVHEYLRVNVGRVESVRAELYNQALSVANEELTFHTEGADSGRTGPAPEGWREIRVQGVRLRDLLRQPVDMLKLDVEGAETALIEDCRDMLHNVRNIFVEYHSFVGVPQSLHRILAILGEAGFRVYLQPVMAAPQPLWERTPYLGMDVQANLFGTRE